MLVNAHNKVTSKPIALKLPNSKALSNRIRRVREKMNLGIVTPKTQHELYFDHVFTITNSQKACLLYDSGPGDGRIVIFCTEENLNFLSLCDVWYMDVCPPLFSQVYTIHGNKAFFHFVNFFSSFLNFKENGLVRSFVLYWLLTKTYTTIFDQLKLKKPSLSPKHIMTDFEISAINATTNAYPGCETWFFSI